MYNVAAGQKSNKFPIPVTKCCIAQHYSGKRRSYIQLDAETSLLAVLKDALDRHCRANTAHHDAQTTR